MHKSIHKKYFNLLIRITFKSNLIFIALARLKIKSRCEQTCLNYVTYKTLHTLNTLITLKIIFNILVRTILNY